MHRRIRAILERVCKVLGSLKPFLEALTQAGCLVSSAWARSAHRRLATVQWALLPQPENFDHHINLFYWWRKSRNPQWVERGVYGALCLKGGNVLELCCGDGFNSRNFNSLIPESVVGCDFDPLVLRTARRKNHAPNVSFVEADIRTNMPDGMFVNVIWDAAIEHFTPEEIGAIIRDIKIRLRPHGVVSGHTVVEKGGRPETPCPSRV